MKSIVIAMLCIAGCIACVTPGQERASTGPAANEGADASSGVERRRTSAPSARGLDEAIREARADLAAHLGVPAEGIRVSSVQPVTWPAGNLSCPEPLTGADENGVAGFRLVLEAAGRPWTYHVEGRRVRACPPIENR